MMSTMRVAMGKLSLEYDSQATTSTENFVEYEKEPFSCKVLELVEFARLEPVEFARLEPVEFARVKSV